MKRFLLIMLTLLLTLAACTPGEPSANEGSGQPQPATDVYLDDLTLNIMESFPLQVSATVRGSLADGCVVLDGIKTQRSDDNFELIIETHREGDACTEALVPFQETVTLDVAGLPAGNYTVTAGDLSESFTFDVDNVMQQEEPITVPTFVYLDDLTIIIMESFPVQVSATVRGNLANGCIVLDGITSARNGDRFELEIAAHDTGGICTQALVPFEQAVKLDVGGLAAGDYTVHAGDLSSSFSLAVDNTAIGAEPQSDEIVITLERTACFGACPIYRLALRGDGTVLYEGQRFVDVTGTHEAQIDPQLVSELAQQMVAAGYFHLADRYTRRYVTDLPGVITSLTIDGETKQIERYTGDDSAPLTLVELENKIDEVANSIQWTGQEPQLPDMVGMQNPAAAFCEENGGKHEFRINENGSSVGVCVFDDGSECEEEAYMRGDCAPGDSRSIEAQDGLAGTSWQLQGGFVEGRELKAVGERPLTINFVDGQINGSGGCNSYFADYNVSGNTIAIGPVGATRMACGEEIMQTELAFFKALESAFDFSLSEESLTINAPSGNLVFQPITVER